MCSFVCSVKTIHLLSVEQYMVFVFRVVETLSFDLLIGLLK